MFGFKKKITETTDVIKEKYYYTSEDNLLKYLKAWVEILEEEDKIMPSSCENTTLLINKTSDYPTQTNQTEQVQYDPNNLFDVLTDEGLEDRLKTALEKENYETASAIKKEKERRANIKENAKK